MSVTKSWTNPESAPPDLTTGQVLTQTAWEQVLSNLDYLGGSTGSGGTVGSAPSGAIMAFAAGTTDPAGWLLCDGRAISRTTFAALFTAISTSYGVGDGSTTFNIPDYRSRVPMAADNMGTSAGAASRTSTNNALGNTSGEDTHVLLTAELAAHGHSHNHGYSDPGHLHTGAFAAVGSCGPGSGSGSGGTGANTSGAVTGISFSTDATSTGSGTAHNNRQLNQIANYIIKQ